MKNHGLIKAKESDENFLLLRKPALVEYVMKCNKSKHLNLKCFRDWVPSQKEGYLTLFTSAVALGNRNYQARLLLLVLLKFLRDGEMGLRVVGHGERHMANACSSFRAH